MAQKQPTPGEFSKMGKAIDLGRPTGKYVCACSIVLVRDKLIFQGRQNKKRKEM